MEKPEYPLGAYLKSQRRKKRLSLQEVYERTRIRPEILQNIEEGRDLPAPAYLKGFIKTYAKALGLDEVQLFEKFYKEEPDEEQSVEEKGEEKPSKTFLRKEIFFAIFGLGLVLFFIFQSFEEESEPSGDINDHSIAENLEEGDTKTLDSGEVLKKDLEGYIKEGVYAKILMIQSLENTVMYFKVDEQKTVTKLLQKNIWYVIRAVDKIYIRVDGRSDLNLVHEGRLLSFSSEHNFERTF